MASVPGNRSLVLEVVMTKKLSMQIAEALRRTGPRCDKAKVMDRAAMIQWVQDRAALDYLCNSLVRNFDRDAWLAYTEREERR